MHGRVVFLGWVLLFSALAVSCTCSRDEQAQPVAPAPAGPRQSKATTRIIFIEGSVEIKRAGSMEWESGKRDMELATDDKVRTLKDSFATIQFEQGGTLRIGPETLVSVTHLQFEPREKYRRYAFTLMEGKIEAELDALDNPKSEFKVVTPSAETVLLKREVAFQ